MPATNNNASNRIKHIVYLMLENRSLDNVLGWLYENNQRPDQVIAPPGYDDPDYKGLFEHVPTHFNLDSHGHKHWVVRGTQDDEKPFWVPYQDPHEDYLHVNNQLFGSESNPKPGTIPTMSGFYKDFDSGVSLYPWQIMQTYAPDQLKVLNDAARNFAVSDAYFSSVPTQTNCNRAFALTGNSIAPDPKNSRSLVGWVNNNMGSWDNWYKINDIFNQRTMFNVIQEAGKTSAEDWMVFYDEEWEHGYCFTRDILSQLKDAQYDPHFDNMAAFFNRAKTGKLPSVCFLEPKWGYAYDAPFGPQGTDYHPPMNVAPGEAFVASILNALQASPNWNETLFILNFDEHGGTYDHVPPPCNASVPWGPGSPTPPPDRCEHNFGFDRFGVRVPLILVSPYIEAKTVFRAGATPYDHTSVIATILTMMGIPKHSWQLGNRVQNAPTFHHILTRSEPRTDTWNFQPSAAAAKALADGSKMDPPPNDLQLSIAIRVLRHHQNQARKANLAAPMQEGDIAPLVNAKTVSELSKALKEAMGNLI